MALASGRRCFADRYLFCTNSPERKAEPAYVPEELKPHVAACRRLRMLLDEAFPNVNDEWVEVLSFPTWQRRVTALEAPLNTLMAQLEGAGNTVGLHVQLAAEAQIPAMLVEILARLVRYRGIGLRVKGKTATEKERVRDDPTVVMYHPAALAVIDIAIVFVMRTMNVLSASSELLLVRLSMDNRLLSLLFECMRCHEAVEMALALIEEVLHAPKRPPDLDLSTIPALPQLIDSLSPFQLGCFCRILAPLVDERDVPICVGSHCSGDCTVSNNSMNHDWQQIKPAANQLRARRSYVGAADRVVRDRNHAVLLAIPGLLEKLVKLIAVPPAPRNELTLVDHALRSGAFTFNIDSVEATGEAPHPGTMHTAILATVRNEGAEDGANTVELVAQATLEGAQLMQTGQQVGGAEQGENTGQQEETVNVMPLEDELRERVLLMMFRRITGLDNDDKDKTGTDKWNILEKRIERATRDHASGTGFQNGVFRERRRNRPANRSSNRPSNTGMTTLRLTGHLQEGNIITLSEVQNQPTDDPNNTPTSETGEANSTAEATLGRDTLPSSRTNEESTRRRNIDEDDLQSPNMSVNALLMSSHQVEILFVLFSLLNGRRKREVQAALIKVGIFPVLDRFCDALDWSDPALETKTEESLKINFVRLLHFMCDGLDTNFSIDRMKWLFSEQEKEKLNLMEGGKDGNLPGIGYMLSSQTLTQMRDAALAGLQSLSINSSPSSSCATPSHSIKSEIELTGSHFQCSPIRSDNHLFDETNGGVSDGPKSKSRSVKDLSSPPWKMSGPAVPAEELSPCLTPKWGGSGMGGPGIICKMTKILMDSWTCKEGESSRRYIVSGCIETFLRTATGREKTLVAQQGLLKHLIEVLSESEKRKVQVSQFRQTSFDLLGQLVKWNRDLFEGMNEIFRLDRKLLASLLKAVSDRLIDSNVFVRSIVVSLERFRAEDALQEQHVPEDTLHVPYDFDNCVLWGFIERFRVRLVYDLLCSVRIEDVNYENICCVNTTLILLVTSCADEAGLDEMLSKVMDMAMEVDESETGGRPRSLFELNAVDIFSNFGKLVDFWKSYYRHQGLDVASQEVSSNIHFDRLLVMADSLLRKLPQLDEELRREAPWRWRGDAVADAVQT